MPAPYNYTGGFIDPTQSLMQTLQMGNMLGQMGERRDARQAAIDAAEQTRIATEQAAKEKAERDARISAAWKAAVDNPSGGAFEVLSSLQPADINEEIRKNVTALDSAVVANSLRDLGKVYAAFKSNNPDIAIRYMQEKADAYGTAGDKKKQEEVNMLISTAKTGPLGEQSAEVMFGLMMAPLPGGKDAIDAIVKLTEEQRAAREAERPEGTKIDDNARKLMNTSVEAAMSSDLMASQATNLADEFERAKPPAGWTGSALEWMKKAAGGQDQFTKLKQEYIKLRNTDVLKNLPPGVASDKDIEIALSAFPDESANPAQITSFLRGTAKLQQYSATVNKAKAEWVNQNGSLGPAQVAFEAGGKEVKKGMTFWDFTKSIPVPNVIGKAAIIPAVEVDY